MKIQKFYLTTFTQEIEQETLKKTAENMAWVVSADMGYGHQRAVSPLKKCAHEKIITVGALQDISPGEKKLWDRMLLLYEFFSRMSTVPVIGKFIFGILDSLLFIPSYYPMRNLSGVTFQVKMLASSIKKGLCSGMMEKIKSKHLPLITSFYAPAIAADMAGHDKIYCIICDADLNRVWVAEQPWESRIHYLAPCGKAAQRLRSYGVPDDRIYITGFPLPDELLGGEDLPVLKRDLARRLLTLDPKGKFMQRNEKNVEHFLGSQIRLQEKSSGLTITFAVGGAGAQKEIGSRIAHSLRNEIREGTIKLNLVAGIRQEVYKYFLDVKKIQHNDTPNIAIIYEENLEDYFNAFNRIMSSTDILWTKPSELSFYCGLGIPIIMTPTIGSQEQFNKYWLSEITAGIPQLNPDYTHEWLFDFLKKGRLADAAWSGFLKARKLGTYKITEILETGTMKLSDSPLER